MIWRFVAVPLFDDPEKTRLARLVYIICIALALPAGLFTLISLISGRGGSFRSGLALVVLSLVLVGINRRGHPRLVGLLLSVGCWVIISIPNLFNAGSGIMGNSFSAYLIPIIIAGFVVNSRLSVLLTIASTVMGFIMLMVELNTPISLFLPSDLISRWVSQSLIYLVVAILISLATHSIRRALEQSQQHELALAQRNADLQAEINARASLEEAYKVVVENSLQALFITQNGQVVFANQAASELFGYTREELLTVPDSSSYLVHPEDQAWIRDYRIRRMRGEEVPSRYEVRIQHKNGSIRWAESFTTLTQYQGKPAIHVALVDITDRKLREESERELALEHERVELLTHLISDISHDLKNPLTSIQTSLYLVEKHTDPVHRKQKLDNIKEQTLRLEWLVRDLLTLSQLDSGIVTLHDTVDLNQMLRDIERRLHVAGEQKNLHFALDLSAGLPPFVANEGELNRAFTNLIDNAITYTPEGGKVTLRSCVIDKGIVIEVCDTGMGIAPEELPHLFERFYRSAEARAVNQNGSGLGLAIVKKIVEKYGGSIQVESTSGQGTTFRVIFPLVADAIGA